LIYAVQNKMTYGKVKNAAGEFIQASLAGVTAAAAVYPAGTSYSFSFEPNEKLDVYTGTFTVKVPVTAEVGTHSVEGVLHYQACDNAACYPPKNLPVALTVTAK